MDKYFQIFGLTTQATLADIKSAYKDLAKVWHPDRFSNDPKLQLKAQEKLKEINEAYEFLLKFYKDTPPQQNTNSQQEQPISNTQFTSTEPSAHHKALFFTKWAPFVIPLILLCIWGSFHLSKPHNKIPPNLTSAQVLDDLDFLIPQAFPHVDNNYLSPVFSYAPKIEIRGPIDEFSIAAITPPFREFPNVLVYQFNFEKNKWERIREGVSMGVDLPRKKSVDLHVAGIAIDYEKNKSIEEVNKFKDYWLLNGYVVVEYDKFMHIHMGGRELYTINRSEFPQIARSLIGSPYTDLDLLGKEGDTCKSYDTPLLNEISFAKIKNYYEVVVTTDNNQKWTLNFTGSDGLYLTNRKISAERNKIY